MKFWRPDTAIYFDERPTDRYDPEAARTAIEHGLPTSFSDKAKRFWKYLEGAAFIFSYKGQLVVTDESLELADGGDGTCENPTSLVRGRFDDWDALERWLEAETDAADAEGWL